MNCSVEFHRLCHIANTTTKLLPMILNCTMQDQSNSMCPNDDSWTNFVIGLAAVVVGLLQFLFGTGIARNSLYATSKTAIDRALT